MDGQQMNVPDRLTLNQNDNKVVIPNGDEAGLAVIPGQANDYAAFDMQVPDTITVADKSKVTTQDYLHNDIYQPKNTIDDDELSHNYTELPTTITIQDSDAFSNKPTWHTVRKSTENDRRIDTIKVPKNGKKTQFMQVESPAETHAVSDYHMSYQQFMQLKGDEKIISLYGRLREQDERIQKLERATQTLQSSNGIIGNLPTVLLYGAVIGLAYFIMKKG